MEEVDKGCPMISMGVSGWMFLLVPAYPGSPGQKAVVCVCNSWLSWLSNLSRRSLVNVNANDLLHPFSHCWHHTATDLVPGQSHHTHTSSESTTISSCRQTWTFSKAVSLPQPKIGKPVAQSRQKRQVCGEFAVVIIAVQKSQNPSFRCKPKTKKPFSL